MSAQPGGGIERLKEEARLAFFRRQQCSQEHPPRGQKAQQLLAWPELQIVVQVVDLVRQVSMSELHTSWLPCRRRHQRKQGHTFHWLDGKVDGGAGGTKSRARAQPALRGLLRHCT